MSNETIDVQFVPIDRLLIKYPNGNAIRQGWSPQCERYPASFGKWGVLKTTAIQMNGFRANENKQLPDKLNAKEHLTVKSGDILITCAGPRSRCGIPCYVEKAPPKLMISGKMYQLRVDQNMILPKYLTYFLQSPEIQNFIDSIKSGSNDSGLNLTINTFKKISVPKLSIQKQAEIINQIEHSFEVIDQGLEELIEARNKLELYRQSVLKDAFEGKLTADWRAINLDKVEPSDKLLSLIEAERKAAHQAELDAWDDAVKQWKAKGKDGKKPSKPSKLMEMHVSNLGLEIDGWIEIKFGCLASSVSNGISTKPEGDAGVKILKINSVRASELNINEHRYIKENLIDKFKFTLKSGDLLFTRYNGSKKFVGVCALYEHEKYGPFVYPDKLIRTRLFKKVLLPEYAMLAMSAGVSRAYIEMNIRSTAGQHGISGQDIKDTPIPICSLQEQQKIVDLVLQAFENVHVQLISVRGLIKKSTSLKQSILKQAFSGYELLRDAS